MRDIFIALLLLFFIMPVFGSCENQVAYNTTNYMHISKDASDSFQLIVDDKITPNIIHSLTAYVTYDGINQAWYVSDHSYYMQEIEPTFGLFEVHYITYHWNEHHGISSDKTYTFATDGWRWVNDRLFQVDIIKDYFIYMRINSDLSYTYQVTINNIAP